MTVSTDSAKINELISRSIDTVYPSTERLKKALSRGKQLRVYVGIDPTADYIHLGHSTNYIILKRFHDLGHKIIVLVGDFTAMIGDPSDKTSMRIKLTRDQVEKNLKTFKRQIGKILDFSSSTNPIEFKFNSEWLSKLTFSDSVELASNFTVQQMIERNAFQKRISDNKPLYVHEFFYPLMQGYDSVALDVDVEIGGTDQTFNMLAGRVLQKRFNSKEKIVITTTLLENPVTGEKLMSKSLGTGVALNEVPNQMYGKIMALPDEGIIQCFIDCTYLALDEIEKIKAQLKIGANPRDIKMRLARDIVTIYHSISDAESAEQDWLAKFSTRQKDYLPDDAKRVSLTEVQKFIKDDRRAILYFATFCQIAKSMSEANRLFVQGAFKINGQQVTDVSQKLQPNDVLQIGKRNYIRIEE